MEMVGEARIEAPREQAWDALNSPQTLQASIPGCEAMERNGDGDRRPRAEAGRGTNSASGRQQRLPRRALRLCVEAHADLYRLLTEARR
jgi:Carbon monoxide dehydrogenase subunit G (CoxG)